MMRRTATVSDEKRITLRLRPELWQRLRLEAARRGVSATLLAYQLIEDGLGELLDDELAPTLNRLEALRGRPAGWNGYDALPPDPNAIDFAEAWLAELYQQLKERGTP